MITLRSGPADVIASATVTTFGGASLVAEVPFDGGVYTIELVFRPGSSPSVRATPLERGWSYELTGFDDTYGRGSAEPVLLASSDSALLWMHFRVLRYGNSPDRSVHLTFYRTDKESVRWQPGGDASETEP
jgi:hypothetical protein